MQAVVVNTAGGVTGGDAFDCEVCAQTESELTVTTQAAERAYAAQPGQTGRIVNVVRVEENARLNWLPQETILFDCCNVARTLNFNLARSARLLAIETLAFGRGAMGEVLTSARFDDQVRLYRDGALLFADNVTLSGDIQQHLMRRAVAGGASAMASVIYVAPDAAAFLPQVCSLLPATAGASLIQDDMLVLRAVAANAFALRRTLIPLLTLLHARPLPRSWMI